MTTVKFVEKETLGLGWSLEVRRSRHLLGHIRRNASSGAYRYLKGPSNILTPAYEEYDLEDLKRRIAQGL